MESRQLGASSVEVSRLVLGAGNFGGVGSAPEFFGQGETEEQAFEVMDAAWALGMRPFDTADAYGGGRSEEWIGKWIAGRGSHPVIVTKTFNPMAAGADRGLSRERMTRQLESSLDRLGVEMIDVYLAHEFDAETPLAQTVATFEGLRDIGLIRAWGVSNFDAAELRALYEHGRPAVVQNAYNLLERADEREVIDLCAQLEIAYMAFGPLAGGLLAGRYRSGDDRPARPRAPLRPGPRRLAARVAAGPLRAPAHRRHICGTRAVRRGSAGARHHVGDTRIGVAARTAGRDERRHRPTQTGTHRRRAARARRAAVTRRRRGPRRAVLGRETLEQPRLAVAAVAKAVVQPVVSVLPELVGVRTDAVPAPVLRTWNVVAGELALELGHRLVELGPVREHAALPRRRRGKLRATRPCREVRVRLVGRDALDVALDADLAPERIPVEEERGAWVGLELAALAAPVAGKEDEAALVGALQQDHPHRWRAVGAGRGQRQRLRGAQARPLRVGIPAPELLQGVAGEIVLEQHARSLRLDM